MFTFIRRLFSNDLLIELSQSKLLIKVFSSNVKYEDEPYIAVEKTNKGEIVKAIGKAAKREKSNQIVVTNPFLHPRSFVGDFLLAEKIIQHAILEIHKSRVRPAPRVIMHQLEKTEGGLSTIEDRVLRELAIGAGAREVIIGVGNKITTEADTFELIRFKISSN